jgi:ribosome-associated protein
MQENDGELYISKTKRKAEADALQTIGKRLIELTDDQINKLALPETLHDAVFEAKRIKSKSALRRQIQYIGRLMRDVDSDPIVEQFERWDGKHQEENARFHALERWRDKLINESATSETTALQAFVTQYPNAEIQRLRHLSRNAHKEQTSNNPPKSTRELFKLLREITESNQAIENEKD